MPETRSRRTIVPVTSTMVDDLASLHVKSLGWSINGRLGLDHIRDLYRGLLSEPGVFGFACYGGEKLICFQIAAFDTASARAAITRSFRWRNRLRLLAHAVLHPWELIDIFEATVLVPHQIKKRGLRVELLTWLSDRDLPAAAFASYEIMNVTLERIRSAGFRYCFGQVLSTNTWSIKLHEGMGHKLIWLFRQNRIYLIDIEERRQRRNNTGSS